MRRVQLHLEDELDQAAAAEAKRRGISKAALVREVLAEALGQPAAVPAEDDPWLAMAGWFDGGDGKRVDIDEVVYGRKG